MQVLFTRLPLLRDPVFINSLHFKIHLGLMLKLTPMRDSYTFDCTFGFKCFRKKFRTLESTKPQFNYEVNFQRFIDVLTTEYLKELQNATL